MVPVQVWVMPRWAGTAFSSLSFKAQNIYLDINPDSCLSVISGEVTREAISDPK
jgi:hypothetical protein